MNGMRQRRHDECNEGMRHTCFALVPIHEALYTAKIEQDEEVANKLDRGSAHAEVIINVIANPQSDCYLRGGLAPFCLCLVYP